MLRGKSTKKDDDVEKGSIFLINKPGTSSSPLTQLKISASKITQGDPTGPKAKIFYFILILFLLYLNVYVYVNKENVNKMLSEYINAREERKQVLETEYEKVSERLVQEEESLIERLTKANDALMNGKSYVHVDHHEGEIWKLTKEKDEAIAALKTEIQATKEELTKLKKEMGVLKINGKNFCEECIMTLGRQKVQCGTRRDFLMKKYDMKKEPTEAMLVDTYDCGKE